MVGPSVPTRSPGRTCQALLKREYFHNSFIFNITLSCSCGRMAVSMILPSRFYCAHVGYLSSSLPVSDAPFVVWFLCLSESSWSNDPTWFPELCCSWFLVWVVLHLVGAHIFWSIFRGLGKDIAPDVTRRHWVLASCAFGRLPDRRRTTETIVVLVYSWPSDYSTQMHRETPAQNQPKGSKRPVHTCQCICTRSHWYTMIYNDIQWYTHISHTHTR